MHRAGCALDMKILSTGTAFECTPGYSGLSRKSCVLGPRSRAVGQGSHLRHSAKPVPRSCASRCQRYPCVGTFHFLSTLSLGHMSAPMHHGVRNVIMI